jgi:hypothetical protein
MFPFAGQAIVKDWRGQPDVVMNDMAEGVDWILRNLDEA